VSDPAHLIPSTSDRGFDHLPVVSGTFAGRPHGFASLYESSNAEEPCVWLHVREGGGGPSIPAPEATVQLTLDAAAKLRDQLTWLIEHHYQADDDG
jgi:hypothetical protein